jgi:formate hydrogenlyase subunit 3/multisubunit Na+/H+ antiporter MnhD subunit
MTLALLAPLLALASALTGLLAPRAARAGRIAVFALLGASGLACIGGGVLALIEPSPAHAQLPLGLPWLQWHLRLDGLSGFFLALIGAVLVPVSLFGPGYTRAFAHAASHPAVLHLFTGLFVAGMQLVVLADDAFMFMVAWEIMSLASYFLVAYEHQHAANRRAAFLYLLMAHVGALAILLGFGVLSGLGGAFSFDAMRASYQGTGWASVAFALALAGFGMKAGLMPLHAWLPQAHPAAPSHVSALMSGVMLKIAVYGFVRFAFDLLSQPHWGWGVATLIIGSVSALLGVLYALMEHDLKRLLAYHSVENIGIIFIGLGLSLLFGASGAPSLAALGLVAALYHTLNHALFKTLLFFGAGAILHSTHERDMEHMGGLIHRMPTTASCFLIGCISISALPPFNGFVSEWLTFQAFLQVSFLESGALRAMLPFAAAMLALTGALAAACFVKVFGVVFLGLPRSRHVRHAREADAGMRAGQILLAASCLVFGVLPTFVIDAIQPVTRALLGGELANATASGWLWLTPVSPQVASYSAPLVLAGIALAGLAISITRHHQRRIHPVRRSQPWDCGFGALGPRMQYTATAFAMPIRRIFQPVWHVREATVRNAAQAAGDKERAVTVRHTLHIEDRAWDLFYEPFARGIQWTARQAARLQTGRIRTYLAHSFITLLILLWVAT